MEVDTTLLAPGDAILIGLSGGADSLALLHALCGLRHRLGLRLVASHLHHGMRGAEADLDVRFLEERCTSWDVPLVVARVDVPELARRTGLGLEAAGREARYAEFDRVARLRDCNKVATAHHADDQAETVLLHLFQGSGLDGLAGIPLRRPLSDRPGAPELVRPLLGVSRSEIESYCREHSLEPRHDGTNDDLHFLRNRIRHQLLPELARYDPRIRTHLVQLAVQVRSEVEELGLGADELLGELWLAPPPGPVWTPPGTAPPPGLLVAPLLAARPARAARALRQLLRRVGGETVELSQGLIARLLALAAGRGPAALDIPGAALRFRRRRDRIEWEHTFPLPPPPAPVDVLLGSRRALPEFGFILALAWRPAPADPRTPAEAARFAPGAVAPPLILRVARPGDRFQPLGAPGRRLLSDYLTDRRVPRLQRARWPVLTDSRGIVWVVGHTIDERLRVTGEQEVLEARAEPLPGG